MLYVGTLAKVDCGGIEAGLKRYEIWIESGQEGKVIMLSIINVVWNYAPTIYMWQLGLGLIGMCAVSYYNTFHKK